MQSAQNILSLLAPTVQFGLDSEGQEGVTGLVSNSHHALSRQSGHLSKQTGVLFLEFVY